MEHKKYTAYSVISSVLEEAALAAVVLWALPEFGINIPLWGLILMMFGLGAYEYIGYRIGKKTLDKKPIVSPDIGSRGRTTTQLAPTGYVKVGSELWKASSTGPDIDEGEQVVVVGVEALTLLVAPQNDNKVKH